MSTAAYTGWRGSGLCGRSRRGAAAIIMVILLLVMNMVIIGLVLGGARDQDLTVRRAETIRAFYAAEAGMNMAMRELVDNTDHDGDGTVGAVSDDGNAVNDPAIGAANVFVTRIDGASTMMIRSEGRAGAAMRSIEGTLE